MYWISIGLVSAWVGASLHSVSSSSPFPLNPWGGVKENILQGEGYRLVLQQWNLHYTIPIKCWIRVCLCISLRRKRKIAYVPCPNIAQLQCASVMLECLALGWSALCLCLNTTCNLATEERKWKRPVWLCRGSYSWKPQVITLRKLFVTEWR